MNMSFYTAEEIVCEEIGNFLKTTLIQMGVNVQELVQKEKSFFNGLDDLYSRALLCKGIVQEVPLFSNIPYPNFKWDTRNNLEKVFEALGFPTTQKKVYILARDCLQKKKDFTKYITPEQKKALLEVDFVKKLFDKSTKWCEAAEEQIAIMSSNMHLLATVTEEEKEFSNSLSFDWYYSYSDDNGVWRAGNQRHHEVAEHVRATLVEKPYLQEVVNVVAKANGLGPGFFTCTDK